MSIRIDSFLSMYSYDVNIFCYFFETKRKQRKYEWRRKLMAHSLERNREKENF